MQQRSMNHLHFHRINERDLTNCLTELWQKGSAPAVLRVPQGRVARPMWFVVGYENIPLPPRIAAMREFEM